MPSSLNHNFWGISSAQSWLSNKHRPPGWHMLALTWTRWQININVTRARLTWGLKTRKLTFTENVSRAACQELGLKVNVRRTNFQKLHSTSVGTLWLILALICKRNHGWTSSFDSNRSEFKPRRSTQQNQWVIGFIDVCTMYIHYSGLTKWSLTEMVVLTTGQFDHPAPTVHTPSAHSLITICLSSSPFDTLPCPSH